MLRKFLASFLIFGWLAGYGPGMALVAHADQDAGCKLGETSYYCGGGEYEGTGFSFSIKNEEEFPGSGN